MLYFFSLCVLISSSDFNVFNCTIFCDMLVALVALCHLFESSSSSI